MEIENKDSDIIYSFLGYGFELNYNIFQKYFDIIENEMKSDPLGTLQAIINKCKTTVFVGIVFPDFETQEYNIANNTYHKLDSLYDTIQDDPSFYKSGIHWQLFSYHL